MKADSPAPGTWLWWVVGVAVSLVVIVVSTALPSYIAHNQRCDTLRTVGEEFLAGPREEGREKETLRNKVRIAVAHVDPGLTGSGFTELAAKFMVDKLEQDRGKKLERLDAACRAPMRRVLRNSVKSIWPW